jgi:16S rRNA (guanine966-N2)-methyltransferase
MRATRALVKEATFSILFSLTPRLGRVLDLYAGTGALGLEALSRGAEWVDFVERDPACCALIRQNLAATGLAGRARVYCLPVRKALPILEGRYDIILLDPPYGGAEAEKTLQALGRTPRLVGEAVVVEHSTRQNPASCYGSLALLKRRRYGDTSLSIYKQEDVP